MTCNDFAGMCLPVHRTGKLGFKYSFNLFRDVFEKSICIVLLVQGLPCGATLPSFSNRKLALSGDGWGGSVAWAWLDNGLFQSRLRRPRQTWDKANWEKALKVCINGKMNAARLVVISDADNFSSLKCGRETYLRTSAGISPNNWFWSPPRYCLLVASREIKAQR